MANDFPSETKPKLYDFIVFPDDWQRYLDWGRRGRPFVSHRRRRPIVTTLNFWKFWRNLAENVLPCHCCGKAFR